MKKILDFFILKCYNVDKEREENVMGLDYYNILDKDSACNQCIHKDLCIDICGMTNGLIAIFRYLRSPQPREQQIFPCNFFQKKRLDK